MGGEGGGGGVVDVQHVHVLPQNPNNGNHNHTATGTALRDPPQIHRFPQTKYIDAVRWLLQLSAFDRFAVLSLFDSDSNTRFPQTKFIDAVRWLPQLSAFNRFAVLSLFDSNSNTPSLEIHSLNPQSQTLTLIPQSTFSPPSRISSLKTSQTPTHKPLIAASTFSGSLHLLFANAIDASLESECSVPAKELHIGVVSCVDVKDGEAECVTVEGLRSAVVYLQSLTDQWVSIRSMGSKFLGLFTGFSNLGLKFMALFLGLMFVWRA
ncbi:hypothetical protein SO802_031629 [Lithocarpus litseifolius]|uniref:Uncharacterized protein n=1 Tax=Lithocarpus litseifolius TaxID=425828 RepID=A0AAW2BM40_9ROSI